MIQLTSRDIQLQSLARTKEQAIRAAGGVLVAAGHIAPAYVDSMLGRESQADTYLAHGIAIPHGMQQDRGLIHRTGVSVVQLSQAVEWSPGLTVRLVVGIAASSDEHLGILAALTDVLDDPSVAERLASTLDANDVIVGLTAAAPGLLPEQEPAAGSAADFFVEVELPAGAGLHARPATVLGELARSFAADIQLSYKGRRASAKSLAALLKLAAEGGARLRVEASGPDAARAILQVREAIRTGLGDEAEPVQRAPSAALPFVPASSGRAISAVSAAPGMAVGRLYRQQALSIVVADSVGEVAHEKDRLSSALQTAYSQLDDAQRLLAQRAGKAQAAIFRAHQAFLEDGELLSEVLATIEAGHSAAWSFQQAIEVRVAELSVVDNERLAARAHDLRDVAQRVLVILTGVERVEPSYPDEPFILVADDLSPSDAARLDLARVLGLCTSAGGPTSHTAIIARSLDLPALVGAGGEVLALMSGLECILDATAGKLYVEPTARDLELARAHQRGLGRVRELAELTRYEPAIMRDGHRMEVVANIGKPGEAAEAVLAGAEGVGLLRSEFLFLERSTPPSEDEQFAAYTTMTRALNGLPLIVRTLDIGGDKVVPYLDLPHEDNPFLGVRGIRLCLQKPELFLPQLRAIYRASATGPIKIMFPMITTLEDLCAAKQLAEQVRREVGVPPVPIGIMVEVPSVALLADAFAEEADFFSIGTNDLTQYTLAIDRVHPELAKQADSLHPSVLRLIDLTVRAAEQKGKWVGVCGGLAGDPLGALIMAGLGVRELSMSTPSIPVIKARLRDVTLDQTRELAKRALAARTASEVRSLVS